MKIVNLELSKEDKDLLISPIVDEVGIIDGDTRLRIINSLNNKIEKIIIKKFGTLLKGVLEFINSKKTSLVARNFWVKRIM